MIKRLFQISFLLALCFSFDSNAVEPPKIGNFALPDSQQPGPFIGFGQNIIDKGQTQLFLFADAYQGPQRRTDDVIPSVLYAITDDFSVFFNVPFATSYKANATKSSGIEDIFLQLEYAYYNKKTATYTDQFTLVANMTFPTGSGSKVPPTGVGSTSYFLGATFGRIYVDWFAFTSYGAIVTTARDQVKFGNQALYEVGIGRNIFSVPSKWIVAWMLEGNGLYSEKNKFNSVKDPNSGGNLFFMTPSLWVSSPHLILQLGVGFPVIQDLFGTQPKYRYLLAANIGWTLS